MPAVTGGSQYDDYHVDWVPPPRRMRGSRSLGEQNEAMEHASSAPRQPVPAIRASSRPEAAAEQTDPAAGEELRKAAEEAARQEAAEIEAEAAAELEVWDKVLPLATDPERQAIVRILQELFSQKYHSFSKPFVSRRDAANLGVSPTLVDVRSKFVLEEVVTIKPFAAEVSAPHRSASPFPPSPPRPPRGLRESGRPGVSRGCS